MLQSAFHSMKGDNLAMFNALEIFLPLAIDFETLRLNKSKQYLLCLMNVVYFEGTLLLRRETHAVGKEFSNSVEVTVLSPVN